MRNAQFAFAKIVITTFFERNFNAAFFGLRAKGFFLPWVLLFGRFGPFSMERKK